MTASTAFRTGLLAAAALLGLAGSASAQSQLQYSLTLYDQPDYRGGSVTFYADNANIGSTGFATRARSAQIRGTWRLCEGGGYRNRCEVLSENIRNLDGRGFGGRVGSAQLLGPASAAQQVPAAPPARYDTRRSEPYVQAPAPYADSYASRAYPPAPAAQAPYGQPAPYAPEPNPAKAYGPAPREPGPDYTPPAVDVPSAPPSRYGRPAYAPPPQAYAPAPPEPYAEPESDGPAEGRTAVFFPEPTLRDADVSARTARAADGFCRAQGLGAAIYFDQSQRLPRAVDLDGRPVGEGPVLRDVLCRK